MAFQLNSASASSEAVLGGVLRQRTGANKQYVTSSVRTPRSLTMESALGGFEKEELLRVKAGHITQETHRNKIRTLRKHLIPFLESKYVVQTNQIRPDSFQDYALWRSMLPLDCCGLQTRPTQRYMPLTCQCSQHFMPSGSLQ